MIRINITPTQIAKIKVIYDSHIIPYLHKKIKKELDKPLPLTNAQIIVDTFLRKYFVDTSIPNGTPSDKKIGEYLLAENQHNPQQYMKGIIRFFTQDCVRGMAIDDIDEALEILKKVFNYDRLKKDTSDFPEISLRNRILASMDVPVCPYCNRQYITVYPLETNAKGFEKTTADLDHFYIKKAYPYLALSLYNFIPSCQICNSRFKHETDFYTNPHVYPYLQEFGNDVKFSIMQGPIQLNNSFDWMNSNILVLEDSSGNNAIAQSIDTFRLREVYQTHTDYLQELWEKAQRYPVEEIEMLVVDYPDLFHSEQDLLDQLFGNMWHADKVYKRPLAKLTRDLLRYFYGTKINR